jgi:tetratricopeptide (TPR) repeat protein
LLGTLASPGGGIPVPLRFRIGETVNGRYEVLRILGEGSMGVVYGVRDQLFPTRRVALKTMQRLTAPELLSLFRAEFRALAELRHAHIAQVYDFEELRPQGGHLFTMEFVEGQELDVALRARDLKRVWRAVMEMAEALAFVHGHGRLHLDIKPSNAMLTADGLCKLLDFGLVGLAFTPGKFAGTPLYMAPEILKGQIPDARADLYSLGITAYQLLTGRVPYSSTTRLRDLYLEKIERVVDFPQELHESIPTFMREAVRKLCALSPDDRFASAKEFLDATRDEAAAVGAVGSQRAQRLERSTFVGRAQELKQVLDFAHMRLAKKGAASGARLCCVGAPSGLGKSRLLAEARTLLQSEGHVFLQGDAYDQDVGEYTALAPVLLAASHLSHAQGAVELIHEHGPELVKIVPEFGLPIVCPPSSAFSNGEAERARLIKHAAAFLVELAQRRPLVVYLNDLQWAGEGTILVLHQLLEQLKAHPDSHLALFFSYRSDEVRSKPIEKLLTQLSARECETVQLQALSAAQVGAMMSSMLLATVSQEISSQMQQATDGIPFLVEESTRWLVSQGALMVRNGACAVKTESGTLDLHREVGKGIVARAALQGEQALRCLQLLAVCARPIELEHLRLAMEDGNAASEASSDLSRVLAVLEAEQFVVAVAGTRPRYALSHDRIRESLFAALPADTRCRLHGRLGDAFESFFLSTNAAEMAVLAAVHQNATPVPEDSAARTHRCEVNLRAAEVAAQAADFAQALSFLGASEALLMPDVFLDYARGMRLTFQRARIFGAMLRYEESLKFAQQAIRHARSLAEEGQALLISIRALIGLRRYDEAVDACVDFCNRLDPQTKLPQHPGLVDIVVDVIRLGQDVQRASAEAFFARLDEPEDPERDLVYELIAETADALYLARPMLHPRMTRHGMLHLLRGGVSVRRRGSAVFVVLMGGLVLGAAGMFERAIALGRAARRIAADVPLETRGRHMFMVETFSRHLDEPVRTSLPHFLAGAAYARQARDTTFVAYHLAMWGLLIDYLGEPLDELRATYTKLMSEPEVLSSQEAQAWFCSMDSVHAALQARGDEEVQTGSDAGLSKAVVALRTAARLRGAALGVGPRSYRPSEYGFPALLRLSMGLGGCFVEGIIHFHAGLVYLAALRGKLTLLQRLHFRAAAAFVISKVRTHARHNSTDYAHCVALLDAEELRNRGEFRSALPLYEKAARLAQENGWPHEAALVLEKLTEVLGELGETERAHATANESIALYRRWQAWAKVEQMERMAAATSHAKAPSGLT